MIDIDKLKAALAEYKVRFHARWKAEKYKWEAIQHFQDHWDAEAADFGAMFREATAKTKNLLASAHDHPRAMIENFAKADPDATRAMFRVLYDESAELSGRVESFQATAEELRKKYDPGSWKSHFQYANAISTYLWLRFPDRHYIYKHELFKAASSILSADFSPSIRRPPTENMLACARLYDEIREVAKADSEFVSLLRGVLSDGCWPDAELRTATMDLVFFMARTWAKEETEPGDSAWFPQDYSPDLSVEDWVALLNDSSVFNESSLQIVKRLKDFGGAATCTQLARKYGETANFYNSGSAHLAMRVAKKTGCPLLTGNTENSKWWPVLYTGRYADRPGEGIYIWRLRDELDEALGRVDLSGVPLYARQAGKTAEAEEAAQGGGQPYSKADFLAEVFMEPERFDLLAALLRAKKNVILQGAPGVGKTFAARRLAYAMMGETDDSRIAMVQFHQSYSYEDFVQGYRPDGNGFQLREGVFYRFCRAAAARPDLDHFFLIDEINRGNLSKIFGELLMLVEKDYRGTSATLAYGGEPFSVPENLYLIGMMNSADRSLAMIDYALRRRFGFFEMAPGFDSDGFMKYQRTVGHAMFDALVDAVRRLNREISDDPGLGTGFQIGHSHFCGLKGPCTRQWLWSVVEFDIVPTLKEYWFDPDDREKLRRWERVLRGVFDG